MSSETNNADLRTSALSVPTMMGSRFPRILLRKYPGADTLVLCAVVVLAVAARVVYASAYEHVYDDTFTTLRYAENIALGKGYVFNEGERVYGASSPLYTLLMSGVGRVVPENEMASAACCINVLSLIAFALLLWRFLPLSLPARLLMVVLILAYPRIFYWSISGMEESLILLLAGIGIVGILRNSSLTLGIACGLLLLAKVDTVVWVACLLAAAGLQQRRLPWRAALAAAVIILPWIAFSAFAFGSIVPHTIEAKRVAYAHEVAFHIRDAVMLAVPNAFRSTLWLVALCATVAYGAIAVSFWIAFKKKNWLLLIFPSYCALYTVVLLVSATPLGLWERWTIPHWSCVLICFCIAADHLVFSRRGVSRVWDRTGVIAGAFAVQAAMLAAVFAYQPATEFSLEPLRDVGDWLHDHASPDGSVFLEPIGYIGFHSKLYVHDLIGLVSPEVTARRRMAGGSNRWFSGYLRDSLPSYVVLRSTELKENEFLYGGYGDGIFIAEERAWFDRNYSVVFTSDKGPVKDHLVLFRKHE